MLRVMDKYPIWTLARSCGLSLPRNCYGTYDITRVACTSSCDYGSGRWWSCVEFTEVMQAPIDELPEYLVSNSSRTIRRGAQMRLNKLKGV